MLDDAVYPRSIATSMLAASARLDRRESLAEVAYARIRELIIALELPPAALIDERALAERLGLGLTPVRQALRRLEWENFVVILPRRGTLVADMNREDLERIFELRIELESLAARLAGENATAGELAALRGIMDRTHLALAANEFDPRGLIQLDRELHRAVAVASHNHMLERTAEWLYGHVLRLWNVSLDEALGLSTALADHEEMVVALEAGDGARAGALMREHVEHFQTSFSRI